MENLKIRVNSESESKEAQYLGEQLGYVRPEGYTSHCKKGGYVCLGFDCDGNSEKLILMVCGFRHEDMESIKDYKEITLPQLRDLVVLNRNDVGDATHTDGHYNFYVGKDKNYFFSSCDKAWRGTWKNVEILKPIEKPMKEYLVPQGNGKYALTKAPEKRVSDWVEVPKGATFYAEDSNMGVKGDYFFKLRSDDFDAEAIYLNGNWMRACFDVRNMTVLWQRHTQPEELPFVDDEPVKGIKRMEAQQEIVSIPDSELKRLGILSLNDTYAEIEAVRHNHYFKDVSDVNQIDVYEVLRRFDVVDPCLQHIIKKALCAGQRGHKDFKNDLQDILDTAKRAVEINK